MRSVCGVVAMLLWLISMLINGIGVSVVWAADKVATAAEKIEEALE